MFTKIKMIVLIFNLDFILTGALPNLRLEVNTKIEHLIYILQLFLRWIITIWKIRCPDGSI